MDKHEKWLSRPWLVMAADSPTNGAIERCRWLLSAVYVACVFRVAGWHVRIAYNPHDYSRMEHLLQEVEKTWKN